MKSILLPRSPVSCPSLVEKGPTVDPSIFHSLPNLLRTVFFIRLDLELAIFPVIPFLLSPLRSLGPVHAYMSQYFDTPR